MIISSVIIVASIFVLPTHQVERLFLNGKCKNKDGSTGICTSLVDCKTGFDDLVFGKPAPTICGIDGDPTAFHTLVVCCSRPDVTTQRSVSNTKKPSGRTQPWSDRRKGKSPSEIAKLKCEEYSKSMIYEDSTEQVDHCARLELLVVGGDDAQPREYPHMALIGFRETDIRWLCGGSLISEKFILSAAHCSHPAKIGPAQWAKLGELDTATESDDAMPEVFRIVRRINHPEYSLITLYNDIALFELEKNVVFGSYIRPICLSANPTEELLTATATGWGNTAWGGVSSLSLLKVKLNIVNNTFCNMRYRNVGKGRAIPEGILEKSMVCAGGEVGKDTCQGDSGGPLQIPSQEHHCMYELIGLTSFGNACGKGYPGIYSRVSYYLPWIVQNVWPE